MSKNAPVSRWTNFLRGILARLFLAVAFCGFLLNLPFQSGTLASEVESSFEESKPKNNVMESLPEHKDLILWLNEQLTSLSQGHGDEKSSPGME